ncbi:hypothetical protein SOV_10070 [Sporomusa ovata DSM 2662]|uniref:Uncharacterized protein n=1 Tax=Sporomusa ovata TaxID=2378 RepID=A0A0U1KY25_9FIRM|nr:hypothetical protein [Sporomusa ovata]EQB28656.1 hypothetical protein SOV_1c03450 [Sporomusa ovata DSM 2662]CQR72165.1 hypothetical protein SpAn4DRAFT_5054 [Sporomusa ovata]
MENDKTTIVDIVGNFVQSGQLQLYIDSLTVHKSVDNVDNFGITRLFVVD